MACQIKYRLNSKSRMSYFSLYPMSSMSLWNLSLLALFCLNWFSHFIDAMEITLIFYVLCFHSWHSLMPVKSELIFGNDSSGDLGPECRYCFLFTTLHGMLWSGHFTPLHYTHPISVNLLFKLGLRLTRTLLSLCSFPIWRSVNPIHHWNSHTPLDPGKSSKSQSESIREKWWQVW